MQDVVKIILLTTAAGSCIFVGGALASFERIRPDWLEREFRHFVIALGGGILLGAVTVVLVPVGMAGMDGSLLPIAGILAGGVTFFFVERALGLRRREAPQLTGMLLDYVPEAVALGGLVAAGSPIAPLFALLIGLQNLPEGFNAYREIICSQRCSPRRTLWFMARLVLIGPLAGLLGYFFLAQREAVLSLIMLFAAGGILYLIFQDIAPQARLNRHWLPPLGAVFGFAAALLAEVLLGHA